MRQHHRHHALVAGYGRQDLSVLPSAGSPSMRLSTGPYPALRRRADYLLRHDPERDLYCVRSLAGGGQQAGRGGGADGPVVTGTPAPAGRAGSAGGYPAGPASGSGRRAGLSSRQAGSWPARPPPLRPARRGMPAGPWLGETRVSARGFHWRGRRAALPVWAGVIDARRPGCLR